MASQGPNSPGTCVDDATIGTIVWSNPNNAKISDNIYSSCSWSGTLNQEVSDNAVKIVKADGSIGATNKAAVGTWPGLDTYISYGGAVDLWGEAWTPANINSANFGVVISAKENDGSPITHYLKATNFGFTIPAGATINGILVEIEKKYYYFQTALVRYQFLDIDHIRITVYYTEVPATNIKINISDVFKEVSAIKINISDVWKDVTKIQINIGGVWKTVFG